MFIPVRSGGVYKLQIVKAKDFNNEFTGYKSTNVMSELLGEYVLKMVYNEVYHGGILRDVSKTALIEATDIAISKVMDNIHKAKGSKTPMAYVSAIIKNRLRYYKLRNLYNGTKDIYDGSLLLGRRGMDNGNLRAKIEPLENYYDNI